MVSAQRFTLKTAKGDYPCVFLQYRHICCEEAAVKNVEVTDILFDAGFESKEEAESFWCTSWRYDRPTSETIKTANGKTSSRKLGTTVTQ